MMPDAGGKKTVPHAVGVSAENTFDLSIGEGKQADEFTHDFLRNEPAAPDMGFGIHPGAFCFAGRQNGHMLQNDHGFLFTVKCFELLKERRFDAAPGEIQSHDDQIFILNKRQFRMTVDLFGNLFLGRHIFACQMPGGEIVIFTQKDEGLLQLFEPLLQKLQIGNAPSVTDISPQQQCISRGVVDQSGQNLPQCGGIFPS